MMRGCVEECWGVSWKDVDVIVNDDDDFDFVYLTVTHLGHQSNQTLCADVFQCFLHDTTTVHLQAKV